MHPCAHPSSLQVIQAVIAVMVLQTRGRKSDMEDYHVMAALHADRGVQQVPQGPVHSEAAQHICMAGVFDGHAGCATAAYAAQMIPKLLHSALLCKELYPCTASHGKLLAGALL